MCKCLLVCVDIREKNSFTKKDHVTCSTLAKCKSRMYNLFLKFSLAHTYSLQVLVSELVIVLDFSREDFRKEFQEQNPGVKSMRDVCMGIIILI